MFLTGFPTSGPLVWGWAGMIRLAALGRLLGAVTAVLLLAGCASTVRGTAVADPAAVRAADTPLTVRSVFGDASTLDPCSVVDTNAAQNVREAQPDSEPDALDDCAVDVTENDGTRAYVLVGPLESNRDRIPEQVRTVAKLPRGLVVQQATNHDGFCDAYVTFADGDTLLIDANPYGSDDQSGNLCPAAVSLAQNAATRITAGTIKHRTYPQGSVGPSDPCAMVPSDALASAGIADPDPLEYPEKHECAWVSKTNEDAPEVDLLFAAGQPAAVNDPKTDSTTTVAGRQTIVSMLAQSGTVGCFLSANLNPYTAADYQGSFVEIAQLVIKNDNGSTPAEACTAGKTVAAALWPKLPAAQH